jgi:hypothetical protein
VRRYSSKAPRLNGLLPQACLPEMAATALAAYLLKQAGGAERIRRMMIEDIHKAFDEGHISPRSGTIHGATPFSRAPSPSPAVDCDGFTRENLTVEERQSGEQYRFILLGPQMGLADQERCLDALAAAPWAEFVVTIGSLPIGVPEDFYRRVRELVKRGTASPWFWILPAQPSNGRVKRFTC